MTSITPPCINFERFSAKVTETRFPSKKISTFAQKRIEELFEEHEVITRNFQDFQKGNHASKILVLNGIEEISKKCTENYPVSSKVRQLNELKALLAPIEQKYWVFRDLLTEEERALEEAEKLFLSDCGAKKSQLLRNEQEEYEKSPLFQAFLEKIEQKFNECPRETIYFAYASPTDSRYEKESWVQPFLKNLQAHLKKAGFPTVQLDIVSNRYGANIYEFMERARTSDYVLLFGTESLLDKFSRGISAVCTELIHILRKREEDGKENVHRVFPILLSGEHRSSFPAEYERFSTIRDWRDHSYLYNFQQLFLELLGLPPEDYQPKLRKYWSEVLEERPNENPPLSEWYQQQREAVDTCRRNNDKIGLRAIGVLHNQPLTVDEASAQHTFIKRLKEHYINRSTITILTFREKGKWELTLPVESLYTKLAMITEEERDERRDLSKLDDGRLPTHETIFKAKKDVAPEEIFKLAKGKRAVIYGSAGIGKTTFTTMLLYKWANGELFTEFQTVFCIRLRNLTKNFYPKGPVYHAADILHREYESLGLDRIDSDSQTTLLILDGWDELPPETREGGHLARVFQELQERYPNLLITSRPGAIDVDATEFEILGFSDIQIGVYVDRFFHSHESKAAGIKRFIRQNPLARSLAHIPINLSILCALYDEDDTLFHSETLLTNSALYDRIINQFYKIFLLRRGVSQNEVRDRTLLSIHRDIEPIASCLEEIAYSAALKEGIYTDEREITQIVYRKELEIEDIRRLGLFRIENSQGSFIHLTFQEYFAALHISRFYESPKTRPQALEVVRRIKFNAKFVRILSMVAGVLSNLENQEEALQRYFDDLHSDPRDLAEIYELTLLARCFEECDYPTNLFQYTDFIDRVKQFINSFPLRLLITTLFRGNQKLLFHPDIVTLFNKILSDKNSRENLLCILKEITSYSAMLPSKIFQKLEEFPYKGFSQHIIISILGNIVGEEARKNLTTILADQKVDQYVRRSAAEALREIASAGEKIGEKGVEALITFLADPKVDRSVCGSAVEALREIASAGERIGEKGVETLITLLADLKVGQSVTYALGEIASAGEDIGEKGLEALISFLTDPKVDPYVRGPAAQALWEIVSAGGEIGEKGVEALITLLTDPKVDQYVRSSAASALGEIASAGGEIGEKGVEALITLLTDPKVDEDGRSSAAEALGEIASAGERIGEKGVEALITLLTDPKVDQEVCEPAAYALGKIASAGGEIGEKGVEALITLLTDPKVDQEVCEPAAYALGKIASAGGEIGEKGVEALITLLTDPKVDQYVRELAACALGEIASAGEGIGEKGVEALITLLTDPKVDQEVCEPAAYALGKIASAGGEIGEKGVEALITLLTDPKVDQYVRELAACALGEIASAGEGIGEKGVEALITLLTDPKVDQYVRELAAYALGKIASAGEEIGEKGVEALITLLTDPKVDQDVCELATYTFGKIASAGGEIGEKGVEALITLLTDPKVDQYVRESSAEALREIASAGERIGEKGVEAFISLVADPKVDQCVRGSSAEALREIASAGERIGEKGVEAFISLLTDPKVGGCVREFAAEALREIASAGERIGEKGVEAFISLVADPKVGQSLRNSAVLALGDLSPSDVMKYYPGNKKFFILSCQMNQRGLIKENEKWIITDQIK